MKGNGFPCPKCGSADIRRSRAKGFEFPKMLAGFYPFRCLACGERFSGNIWILATNGCVHCPRCLRLDVAPSIMRENTNMTGRDRVRLAMRARLYRCTPCRLTFSSFGKYIEEGARHPGEKADGNAV